MYRVEETAQLIKQGYNPREIAGLFRISLQSVIQYAYTAVGRGIIQQSDIYFSIPKETRETFKKISSVQWPMNIKSLVDNYRGNIIPSIQAYFDLNETIEFLKWIHNQFQISYPLEIVNLILPRYQNSRGLDPSVKDKINFLLINAPVLLNINDTLSLYYLINTDWDNFDFDLYEFFKVIQDIRGDMYRLICDIEIGCHNLIKMVLIKEYGQDEKQWWRNGISAKIQKECLNIQVDDPNPAESPFCYTSLIHLREIIDTRWKLFSDIFPPDIRNDKKEYLNKFIKLNIIRNYIMHPIKGFPSNDEDFEFLKGFLEELNGIVQQFQT
jgi:hypothetical protein